MKFNEYQVGAKVVVNDTCSNINMVCDVGTLEAWKQTTTLIRRPMEKIETEIIYEVIVSFNGTEVVLPIEAVDIYKEPEPDYSIWKKDGESNQQFNNRQNEIRRNFHKKRVSESWEQYEARTGLPAPVIISRDELEIWADKTIKSICEFHYKEQSRQPYESVHDYRNRITRANNVRCSDVPPIL